MDRLTAIPLRIGAWCVDPKSGQMSRDGEIVRVEARTLRLLLCLAERAGEVVSIDDLLNQAWSGVVVTPDSVYQAVASLRRLLGDDPKQPTYIATVPRLGYRMVATVTPWVNAEPLVLPGRRMRGSWRTIVVALCAVLAAVLLFKGKKVTVAEIARSLGVAYVLDGSVRQSATTLRVAARLVRAADGYVAWSETYDRPSGDELWIQDDIASEVTKALRVAIH
jgi:DNA-binding winged helix-turn-helix (wHTH) protein